VATIIGISGSLREKSFNSALLKAAASLQIPNVQIEIASIRDIPLYNADVEDQDGIPKSVSALKDRIAQTDGLLLVTPEYNNSIPGVFKNAIDWLTRPPADVPRVWGNRPVAVIGASPGNFGTILSQAAWLPIFRTLRTRPWFQGRLLVSHADKTFNEKGELVDESIRTQLREFIKGFGQFIDTNRR
jgi:chromate reductase, NAD(P)H dehydrogenase (quinone)